MWILDLETDGLLPTVTKIHCASLFNINTKEWKVFKPANINNLPEFLDSCAALSCHNGIGFDLKVLQKIFNYNYKGKYRDTLLLSRLLFPDIEAVAGVKSGRHSVEAWGVRFNIKKPEYEDWSHFTEEMLHRNKEDVKIQAKIWEYCITKIRQFETVNLKQAVEMEQKVWEILEQQAVNGWLFDENKAKLLIDKLSITINKIEEKLNYSLPMRLIKPYKETTCKAFKQNGELTTNAANWVKDQFNLVVGDFCRVQFEQTDINSSQQLKDFLFSKGWQPAEWNYKRDEHGKPLRNGKHNLVYTTPKLPSSLEAWDQVALQIKQPDISLIAEYNKAQHRRSQIQGLLNYLRPDKRIEAQAITCSTNTRRMVHRQIVNIPKARETVYYGKELRSLFICPEDKVLIGIDASALEARCEAHYIYPYDPISAIELIGEDIHARNAEVFGVNRDLAKNGKYAILYGCSPQKLATILGKPLHMAKELYDSYWYVNDGVKQFKEKLEKEWEEKGYLLSIDGAPLTIRYKHALINTLFQSCGSIIMKLALCILDKRLKDVKIKCMFIGNFHDEWIIECNAIDANEIVALGLEAMELAGKLLKLNVPIIGKAKIGKNWAEIH